MKIKSTFLAILILCSLAIKGQSYVNSWSSLDSRPIPQWFEDAKFGIFVHWGVYSVPAWRKLESSLYASYAEWYYARVMYDTIKGGRDFHLKNYGENFEYRDFAPMFKAELFDPAHWAKLFKNSGAKYVVLTTKHHDGYCLWPTKSPYKRDWNSMDNGPRRDLVGDLTNAVKREGLKMGLYYSIPEWESCKTKKGYLLPDSIMAKYKIPENEYVDKHLIPQLKELVNSYQPSLIFSDGGEWVGTDDYWKTKEFLAWLYNESPVRDEVVVNDRFAKDMPGKHGDYYSSEYKDMDTALITHPWEENRGIGGSYGLNRAENLEDYSSSAQLLHELIDIVSRGGNLLLNVGPAADGTIPVIMQQRLADIGQWLQVNGEAIYGTRKRNVTSQQLDRQTVYFTTKRDVTYCFFNRWEDRITIKLLMDEKIKKVSLLGYSGPIQWLLKSDNRVEIEIPKLTVDQIPCLYDWVLKIEH